MPKPPGTYLYAGLKAKVEHFTHQSSSFFKTSISIDAIHLVNALNGRESLHCTLMYGEVKRRLPIIPLEATPIHGSYITEVRYIPHADCTCLILYPFPGLVRRHERYADMGLDLGYEFDPHITVSKGNTVENWTILLGHCVTLDSEYLQVIVKKDPDNGT